MPDQDLGNRSAVAVTDVAEASKSASPPAASHANADDASMMGSGAAPNSGNARAQNGDENTMRKRGKISKRQGRGEPAHWRTYVDA